MTPTMRPLPPTDENELLLRLRSGDHSAFETLYCRYARRVAATLLKITRSREMAEDLLQDTFIKVWAVRNNINPNHSFPARSEERRVGKECKSPPRVRNHV